MARQVPRPFHYACAGRSSRRSRRRTHDEPVIQLLRCESGDHDGQEQVRFCFYSLRGAFQRHPLVVGEQDIADLREQLKHAPRLLALPQRLVAD